MIELRNLSKRFVTADGPVEALNNVNLTVNDGDIYGIIGMSGAGKSTLVRCINMLERPTEGSVLLDGRDLGSLDKKQMQEVRRTVTMIFQSFNLLMQSNCLQNVMFPLKLTHMPKARAEARARELLETVGLPDKAKAYPAQLSGGQQQRVAVVRGVINRPEILFADEPTGALNSQNTNNVLEILSALNNDGQSIVMVTHAIRAAERGNRILYLADGVILDEIEIGPYRGDYKDSSNPQQAEAQERHRKLKDFLADMGW